MDWMIFFTAVMAICGILTILIPVYISVRSSDKKSAAETKEDLLREMNKIDHDLHQKVDFRTHEEFRARIDKELFTMRGETTNGFNKLDEKFDKIYDLLNQHIIDESKLFRELLNRDKK